MQRVAAIAGGDGIPSVVKDRINVLRASGNAAFGLSLSLLKWSGQMTHGCRLFTLEGVGDHFVSSLRFEGQLCSCFARFATLLAECLTPV